MSAILLGNGLNRCLKGYPSWVDLLQGIESEFFSKLGSSVNSLLKYDAILCEAKGRYGDDSVSKRVLDCLKRLDTAQIAIENSDLFVSILDSGVKTILTTNYDYNLENALIHGASSPLFGKQIEEHYTFETRASDKRNKVIDAFDIHHIHGEISYPKSICLGITKYIDNLAKTMELLSDGESSQDGSSLGRLIDSNVLTRGPGWKKTWAELFFNSNIYIVGLGLSSDELDIWWLLMRRAQLLADRDMCGKITNRIIYFPLIAEERQYDFSPFDVLHVECEPCKVIGGDWKRHTARFGKRLGGLRSRPARTCFDGPNFLAFLKCEVQNTCHKKNGSTVL